MNNESKEKPHRPFAAATGSVSAECPICKQVDCMGNECSRPERCYHCGGRGSINGENCEWCDGTGEE
jgi:hypothetical protein